MSEHSRGLILFGVFAAMAAGAAAVAGFEYEGSVIAAWSFWALAHLGRGRAFRVRTLVGSVVIAAVALAALYGMAWNHVSVSNRSGQRVVASVDVQLERVGTHSAFFSIAAGKVARIHFIDLFNDPSIHIQGNLSDGTGVNETGMRTRWPALFGGVTRITIERDGAVRIER